MVGGTNCAPGQGFDDRDGHGTSVGGMIGARDNAIGQVGVAPGARLWGIRVADPDGSIEDSWLICGLDFVAATRSDADPTNDIAIANMSLSGLTDDEDGCATTRHPLHIAVCETSRPGSCRVASAGNDAIDIALEEPGQWEVVDGDCWSGGRASRSGGSR